MPEQPEIESVARRELTTSRLVSASPAEAFEAFRDPVRLAQWWGPNGFSNTFDEFDLRPGGTWRFTMRGPDGGHYANESRFVEILPEARVVFRHVSPPKFEMTITFEEDGSQTRIGWRQLFDTVADCDRVRKFAVDANEQNLDRLEAELARRV